MSSERLNRGRPRKEIPPEEINTFKQLLGKKGLKSAAQVSIALGCSMDVARREMKKAGIVFGRSRRAFNT